MPEVNTPKPSKHKCMEKIFFFFYKPASHVTKLLLTNCRIASSWTSDRTLLTYPKGLTKNLTEMCPCQSYYWHQKTTSNSTFAYFESDQSSMSLLLKYLQWRSSSKDLKDDSFSFRWVEIGTAGEDTRFPPPAWLADLVGLRTPEYWVSLGFRSFSRLGSQGREELRVLLRRALGLVLLQSIPRFDSVSDPLSNEPLSVFCCSREVWLPLVFLESSSLSPYSDFSPLSCSLFMSLSSSIQSTLEVTLRTFRSSCGLSFTLTLATGSERDEENGRSLTDNL